MASTFPIRIYDYKTTVVRNKHHKHATNTYVSAAQRKEILLHLDDASLIVFSYYMEKANIDGFDFKDSRVAKALGYNEQKVKRARLKLTRCGWFLQSTYTNHKGRKVVMTFLGKAAVTQYTNTGHIPPINEIDE